MTIAKYDLDAVIFPLLRAGKYAFLAPSRSVDCVISVFPNFGRDQAEKYVVSGLLKLTSSDFATQKYQWEVVMDIYGKKIDGINWFIKFFVEKDENGEDAVSEVSFHPLEEDLELASSIVLAKEDL